MNKGQILERLNLAEQKLREAKEILRNVTSSPIWSENVYEELDGVVELSQNINEHIGQLSEIQGSIMLKPKK